MIPDPYTQSIMQNALEAHMTSSLCLSVLVGCPASPTQLPENPCLIINAESIDREELIAQESFCAHYRELSADDVVLLNQTVISELDHQIVEWHSFSDRRFNGPSQLSEFSEQYPNLRLVESRKIEGITLSTVLVDQKSLSDPLSTFELILREGDPLVVLQSAKEWLARCTRISLRGLVTSSKSREAAEAFLGASGFCKSSVDSCVWTPELEVSSLHLSLIRCGLLALFNADVYRKLYPQTQEMTDVELIDHWLSQPDFRDVSKIMKDATQRNPTPFAELTDQDPALQLLQNIFPFDFYRSQRTDLSQIPNRELINHYWTHGQYEGIDLSESNVKNVLGKDQSLQVNRLNTRIHELEHLLSCANAQISAMQKLIVSSRDSGATNEQD
ncbi:putative conserved secreted protein [Synechococcus sp. A18-46.1]|nr:putative conserved secreted protein [Synechococcus sp. A18-46.1]